MPNFLEDDNKIKNGVLDLAKEVKKQPKKKKKKIFIKLVGIFSIFLITSFTVFSSQVLISEKSSPSWFSNLPIIKQIKNLAESADRQLKGEKDNRINILLLGIGGAQHEGGYLTDTIILASLEPSTKKVSLLSIPRDLSIPIKGGYQKINAINAYAEMKEKGSGGLALSQAISDLLQIPIDYYIRVDFKAFSSLVDEIGGVDINIERTFDDYRYPIRGEEKNEDYEARFEHLHFDKGPMHMDGKLALKYARSRHGNNGEGSDFARAKRQQNIIMAVKKELLSVKTIFKPKMIKNIFDNFKNNISTNLQIWEIMKLWSMFKNVQKEDVVNKVLDNSPNGLLYDEKNERGSYILSPRSGDFTEIQYFVNNVFSNAPKELKTSVINERATVEIRNGTWINGLASQTALDLEKYGFIITRTGNSSQQNFQKSVIYDLSYGEKSRSLSILKEKTGANVSLGLPDWLIGEISQDIKGEENPIKPDFVLILGQDADKTKSGIKNKEKNKKKKKKNTFSSYFWTNKCRKINSF